MLTHFRLFSIKERLKAVLNSQKNHWELKLLVQRPIFIGGFFILLWIPFLLAIFFTQTYFTKLKKEKSHFEEMQMRGRRIFQIQKKRQIFLETYEQTDPDYLTHAFEKKIFLEPEVEALKSIYAHPTFQSSPLVQDRLTHLTKTNNHLTFVEEGHETSDFIQEKYYHQQKPIEVNGEDIQYILSMVEGVAIGPYQPPSLRPQLIFRSFNLKRKPFLQRESYFLDIHLIKREPL